MLIVLIICKGFHRDIYRCDQVIQLKMRGYSAEDPKRKHPIRHTDSYKGIDGCYALDPFQNGAITAVLVNGCYDDGTQFYGEKCGGSNFGAANELAYGDCGPAEDTCACKLYVESKSPGCFAIATPEANPQLAVFLKMEGCSKG